MAQKSQVLQLSSKLGKFAGTWPLGEEKVRGMLEKQSPAWAEFSTFAKWPKVPDFNQIATPYLPFSLEFTVQEILGQRRKRKEAKKLRSQGIGFAQNYVQSIVEKRKVPTREENWHDFLNFISWTQFPHSKLKLYELFYNLCQKGADASSGKRDKCLDYLVHLDEGALLVVTSQKDAMQVKDLLSCQDVAEKTRKFCKIEEMEFVIFGHGLYESMLACNHNINAFSISLIVEESYWQKDIKGRLLELDSKLFGALDSEMETGSFPSILL